MATTRLAMQRTQTIVVAMLPLAVMVVPSRWIERHPVPCLFSKVLGVRCPGCGMTRAVSCAFHGRFRDAVRYNPLVVLVLPLAAIEWLRFVGGAIGMHRVANLIR